MFLKNRAFTKFRPLSLIFAALMVACSICVSDQCAEARRAAGKSHASPRAHSSARAHAASTGKSRGASRSRGSAKVSRSRTRTVVQYSGKKRRSVSVARGSRISSSRRGRKIKIVRQPKPKYAYPLSQFLMHAPSFDKNPLDQQMCERIARAWERGTADSYPARTLVRAGVVSYHPLRGGIYYRREPVKYIILHSTETGVPVSAVNVIEGWSSMGRRHPGAQYVVDRDGTIYQAVDPDLATVHVNIFKTLPGINNDNSIGIEMNHTGRQNYPEAQREAVNKLLAYLQQRYQVENANVVTHRYAQQGDHTDPVNFDLDSFIAYKNQFQRRALAYKVKGLEQEVKTWNAPEASAASTILQPHPTQPVEAVERIDKKLDQEENQAEKFKTAPLSQEKVRTGQPTNVNVNGLELKGPIEVDPSSASDLNQKENFDADGPGATKDGEPAQSPKPPAKKFTPGPDTQPESKLSSPAAPAHTKVVPAHVINQNTERKTIQSAQLAPVAPARREVVSAARKEVEDTSLTQYVPGDRVSRPRLPARPNGSARPAPRKVAEHAVETPPFEQPKPAQKKSVFQRMRAYLKENFQ